MLINPIIPLPIMIAICVGLLFLIRKGVWNIIRHVVIVLLLFAINLRPALPSGKVKLMQSEVDVLLVVDNTISMLAEDYGPDKGRRIDAVKEDVRDIIDAFPGARFSVISLSKTAERLLPYTLETDLVIQAIDGMNGEFASIATGTAIDLPYATMETALSPVDDAYASDADTQRIKVVFFISDGEMTRRGNPSSYADLADYVNGGAVLGYGTRAGGRMRVRESSMDEEATVLYYSDSNYNRQPAISKIDEENLNTIASDLGVPYYHMTSPADTATMISEVAADVSSGENEFVEVAGKGRTELYPCFAAAIVILLGFDFVYYRWKAGQER